MLQVRLDAYLAQAGLQHADAPGGGEHNCCINAALGITTTDEAPDNNHATQIRAQMQAYANSLPIQARAALARQQLPVEPAAQRAAGANQALLDDMERAIDARLHSGPLDSDTIPCLAASIRKTIVLVGIPQGGQLPHMVEIFYHPQHLAFQRNDPLHVEIMPWHPQVTQDLATGGALEGAQVITHYNNHYRTTVPLPGPVPAAVAVAHPQRQTSSQTAGEGR